ncbi:MAG: hypothetical protein JWM67_1449 [Mycobacterium sp.]|nr:hypothetical protein [Mycobacterium sp.]
MARPRPAGTIPAMPKHASSKRPRSAERPAYPRPVSGFWFTIEDAFPADEGWDPGVFLVGPPGETSAGLGCGDLVVTPTQTGDHVTACLGFPLLNLGPDRLRWVRLHVALPDDVKVQVGGRVTKVERVDP